MEGGSICLGACSTLREQGKDGDKFGGGGVVWRSAVVVLRGWQPAANQGRRKGSVCFEY